MNVLSKEYRSKRNSDLKKKYGITLETYEKMLGVQGGVCKICSKYENVDGSGTLAVDHNHDTGEVRDLLCGSCNRAIGLLQDSSKVVITAAAYLIRWNR